MNRLLAFLSFAAALGLIAVSFTSDLRPYVTLVPATGGLIAAVLFLAADMQQRVQRRDKQHQLP